MLEDLIARLGEVEADEGVGAAVITGAGDKAFSAGADVVAGARGLAARGARLRGSRAPRLRPDRVDVHARHRGRQRLRPGRRLRAGAGLRHPRGLGPRPDRPARGDARDLPRLGRHPADAAHRGPGRAKELILTGRRSAPRRRCRGLVERVHPHEELVERAVELAAEIASRPGWAVAAAKAMINRAGDGDQAGNLARELDRSPSRSPPRTSARAWRPSSRSARRSSADADPRR